MSSMLMLVVGALCCGGLALAIAGAGVFVVMRKKSGGETSAGSEGVASSGATLGEIQAMDD